MRHECPRHSVKIKTAIWGNNEEQGLGLKKRPLPRKGITGRCQVPWQASGLWGPPKNAVPISQTCLGKTGGKRGSDKAVAAGSVEEKSAGTGTRRAVEAVEERGREHKKKTDKAVREKQER